MLSMKTCSQETCSPPRSISGSTTVALTSSKSLATIQRKISSTFGVFNSSRSVSRCSSSRVLQQISTARRSMTRNSAGEFWIKNSLFLLNA